MRFKRCLIFPQHSFFFFFYRDELIFYFFQIYFAPRKTLINIILNNKMKYDPDDKWKKKINLKVKSRKTLKLVFVDETL